MNKAAPAAISALAVLLSALPARAQSAQDKAAAEVLFEEGKTLMRERKYAAACPKFVESIRLDTGLGTMLWLADCYDKNGQSASAWGQYREALDIATKNHDSREKVARERSQRLEPTLSRMTITVPAASAAPGMVVKRDGAEVGQPLWGEPVPVDPGSHTVTVSAPRKKDWQTTVQVLRGIRNLNLPVPALEDAPAPPTPAPPLPEYTPGEGSGTPPPPPYVAHGSGPGVLRTVGGILAGIGIAGEGAGIGLYLYAQQQFTNSDTGKSGMTCTNSTGTAGCKSYAYTDRVNAGNATTGEIASFIAGSGLILTGVVLIVVAPFAASKGGSGSIQPWVGPAGGGVRLAF